MPWKVGLYLSTLAMVETRHALGPGATVKRTFLLFWIREGENCLREKRVARKQKSRNVKERG